MRPSPSKTRAGFSMIEVMMVLVILAIAAVMIVPLAVSTASQQAQAAARMVMADLDYARNYAVTTQTEVTVTFDVSQNAYWVTYKDPVSNESVTMNHPITHKDYRVDFKTAGGFDRTAISGVSFGGLASVKFTSLGAPDHDGNVTLAAGAEAYRVTVAPVTGRITVAKVP